MAFCRLGKILQVFGVRFVISIFEVNTASQNSNYITRIIDSLCGFELEFTVVVFSANQIDDIFCVNDKEKVQFRAVNGTRIQPWSKENDAVYSNIDFF